MKSKRQVFTDILRNANLGYNLTVILLTKLRSVQFYRANCEQGVLRDKIPSFAVINCLFDRKIR
jgi:hypothetical protein